MKFLIIDEDPKMCKLIKEEVCSNEDNIIEYTNSENPVNMYVKHLPDFVLIDIQMNTLNGIDITRKICERFPMARVIGLSEDNAPMFRLATLRSGAIAFFPKEDLIKVKEFISRSK